MKKNILFLFIVFLGLVGCSQNKNKLENGFNNEFVYYHDDFHFRGDTGMIDQEILQKIENDDDIVSVLPYYYFETEYCQSIKNIENERKISTYVDGELVNSIGSNDNDISLYVDGYYNNEMVDACTIKKFDFDENMMSGFLSKRAASQLGVTNGQKVTIEINCAIPVSNSLNVSQQDASEDYVYVGLSHRLYKLVTLKVTIKGIISTDVDDIPELLLPMETIKNLIEENQIEDVKTDVYVITTSLNKKELVNLLSGMDSNAKIEKRHWFNENGYFD